MITFLPNNQITLLRGGEEYFPALVTAIKNASQTIYLQTYIYELDKAGISIGSALKKAAHKGVAVNILLDGFGMSLQPKPSNNILTATPRWAAFLSTFPILMPALSIS